MREFPKLQVRHKSHQLQLIPSRSGSPPCCSCALRFSRVSRTFLCAFTFSGIRQAACIDDPSWMQSALWVHCNWGSSRTESNPVIPLLVGQCLLMSSFTARNPWYGPPIFLTIQQLRLNVFKNKAHCLEFTLSYLDLFRFIAHILFIYIIYPLVN